MNGVFPLYIYTINRYKRDGSSEMAVMESGFKYVMSFATTMLNLSGQ